MVFKIFKIKVPVCRIRSITAQLIASMAPSFLLLDLGMAISFVTIVIPSLLNASEGLSLSDNQASWFGSLLFLTQPFGALLSGPIVDYFGRKKATFLVNFPHVVAWILMYYAWNLPSLFIANALLGIGTGLMEAPITAYVSEISDESFRGTLCVITQVFLSIGVTGLYALGAIVSWRVTALICLSAPIVTMLLAIIVVPDTPVWLLSQGKEKEALKSLCYLRGWTAPENVSKEFEELIIYSKAMKCCLICKKENKGEMEKLDTECEHAKMNKIKRSFINFRIIMICKETLRPFFFCLLYFMFYVMSGLYPIKPYMVNVCSAMGMAEDINTIIIMVGMLTLLGNIIVISFIKLLGKRKIAISAMFGSAICCTGLASYASSRLNENVFSYDPESYPKEKSLVPLVFFYGLTIFTAMNVSWNLLGEVFPFRSRATCQGLAAAINYLITFLGAKTLIDLEKNFALSGVFITYAIFAFVGTIFLYFLMPETEGKRLAEIETYYQGKFMIFADDWFINKFKTAKEKKNQT